MNVPPFRPGMTLGNSTDLNAQLMELVRQGKIRVNGADLESAGPGPLATVVLPDRPVYGEILGGSNPYTWREKRPATAGAWTTKTYGRSGTSPGGSGVDYRHPAYEVGQHAAVPVGTIVKMRRGFARIVDGALSQEWLFRYCCTFSSSGSGGYLYVWCCAARGMDIPPTLRLTVSAVSDHVYASCEGVYDMPLVSPWTFNGTNFENDGTWEFSSGGTVAQAVCGAELGNPSNTGWSASLVCGVLTLASGTYIAGSPDGDVCQDPVDVTGTLEGFIGGVSAGITATYRLQEL